MRVTRLLVYVAAAALALFYVYPIANMVFEGFDIDLSSIYAPGFRLIGGVPYYSGGITPSLTYYMDMFRVQGFQRLITNSLVIGTVSALIATVLALLSSYQLTFGSRFLGRNMDYLMLVMRSAPPFVYLLPFLIIAVNVGLWDTQAGLTLAYTSLNIPLAYLLVRSLLRDFPKELVEVAELMGAPATAVLRRVILPLALPGLAVIWTFLFVVTWNEFLLASILTGPDARTVSVGVWAGVGEQIGTFRTVEFEAQAAAGTIAMIVPLLITLYLRRRLARLFSLRV
ncbi:MAG: ABC transporter permease subunit [Aigarchaeota archaeon]|nr:ABC transporter permease subunit [Candidatus Calditenuis fumarioli]